MESAIGDSYTFYPPLLAPHSMVLVHFLTHGPVALLASPTSYHVIRLTPAELLSSRAGATAATSPEIPPLTANMLRSAPSRVMDKSYKVRTHPNPILEIHVTDSRFQAAVEILNARRRQARPTGGPSQGLAGLSRLPERDGPAGVKGTPSIVGMKGWLSQIGHSVRSPYFSSGVEITLTRLARGH